jgi:hypothetical protein
MCIHTHIYPCMYVFSFCPPNNTSWVLTMFPFYRCWHRTGTQQCESRGGPCSMSPEEDPLQTAFFGWYHQSSYFDLHLRSDTMAVTYISWWWPKSHSTTTCCVWMLSVWASNSVPAWLYPSKGFWEIGKRSGVLSGDSSTKNVSVDRQSAQLNCPSGWTINTCSWWAPIFTVQKFSFFQVWQPSLPWLSHSPCSLPPIATHCHLRLTHCWMEPVRKRVGGVFLLSLLIRRSRSFILQESKERQDSGHPNASLRDPDSFRLREAVKSPPVSRRFVCSSQRHQAIHTPFSYQSNLSLSPSFASLSVEAQTQTRITFGPI